MSSDHAASSRPLAFHKTHVDSAQCDGVIWFGNVDWWYHNRGHASVRMATRIAQRVPTLWVNSIGMRLPMPGRTEIAWRRYRRKLGSMAKGLRRDEATGLWIYSPLFIPRYSRAIIELNGLLLAAQVRLVMRRLGVKRPSACVSMPTMTPAVERLPWVKVVFDRCDDFTTLPEADGPLIDSLEGRLLAMCDHAAYVSHDLIERDRGRVSDARFLGHGVDLAQLARARPLNGPRPAAPAAIADLCRPIVGFYGGMDDYRMDADLLIRIARQIMPGTLLLIGPEQMDLSRVKAETNVRHIGQLPPDELAAYAAEFDVGVIPFLRNDFNMRCNPTKLKEYLALGFPIVATELPAYARYSGLIYTAETHDQFLHALACALAENDPALPQRRRDAVAGDDWDRVAGRMAEMLAISAKSSV
jgi:glycosyltransferase involved in cell wall biosynthesis